MRKLRHSLAVIIDGRKWSVRFDKRVHGAEFNYPEASIKIGEFTSEEMLIQWFLHEIWEAIMFSHNYRYAHDQDNNYLFIFDHRQFTEMVKEIYLAIKDILRPKLIATGCKKGETASV